MIGNIFYWFLNISILGSAAGLIVMLIRRIRILPRFGVYLLWTLPLIRFWIPVGIANQYSLLSFISKYTTKTIVVWKAIPGSAEFSVTNSIQTAERYFPIVYKTDLLRNIFSVAGIVWVVIAAMAILCFAALYILTKSKLKDTVHTKDNLYRSNKALSPAVYGIIKPKIILPANIADNDLDYILKHEHIHILRRDNLWRLLAIITACVHWFNPLAWIFLKYFFTDMELACDNGVLKKLNDSDKKAYASVLLLCSSEKIYYASAFSGTRTKLRIENILSYRKLTLISGLCFAALFIIVAITVITNAAGG